MDASSSGATIAVRPDGRRRINRPSDVIPTTRLRIDRVRPCEEYAEEVLRLGRARLVFEATDFSAPGALGWLGIADVGSVFGCTDEFAAVLETELSGIGAAEFSVELVGAPAWG